MWLLIVLAAGITQPMQEVADRINRGEEAAFTGAFWTSSKNLKVGILDNGQSRTGYAWYVCELLREKGVPMNGLRVTMLDHAQMTLNKREVKLGDAWCDDV